MAGRWKVEELKVGALYEATFWANPREDTGYRFRATHLDGRRAPKVVLCDDARVRAGVPCQVRITSIAKTDDAVRGAIEVELVKLLPFRLEGVWLDPIVSKKLQILLESGLNVLLDGPQGCGKSVTAKAIAKAVGMEFVFFNCGAIVEPTDFLATLQLKAGPDGQPVTEFIKTDMLRALEDAAAHPDRRYLLFLDELNRCPEAARNALMPALDTSRRMYNPITGAFVGVGDNVQVIAAVNRGTGFSGTYGIDVAQLDRFAPVQMGYPPVVEEVKLLASRHPELKESLIEQVVQIADRVRKAPELSAGLSVRATDEVCTMLKHPLLEGQEQVMLKELLKSSFCGRFSGNAADAGSDAGVVWAVIEAGSPAASP